MIDILTTLVLKLNDIGIQEKQSKEKNLFTLVHVKMVVSPPPLPPPFM